jgi:transcriptional regulator with XRE-family HTH domain
MQLPRFRSLENRHMKKSSGFAPNLRLKRARQQQGWSQEYVGQQVGTAAFTISRLERGVTMPSPHFRPKLCDLFGLSVVELGLIQAEVEESSDQATGETEHKITEFVSLRFPLYDPNIPPPFAREHSLVGRDDLLRSLKHRQLSGRSVALSAINGLPGVGKTALATALAHDEEIRAQFTDGALLLIWRNVAAHRTGLLVFTRQSATCICC